MKKSTIYKKYWYFLCNSYNTNELINLIKRQYNEYSDTEYLTALKKSIKIYEDLLTQTYIKIITVFDDNYPIKLNVMNENRPLVIYAKGNDILLNKSNMAIMVH